MVLWHFTCDHGRKGIGKRGIIKPNPHPLLGIVPLIWLTDSPIPDKDALGLTNESGLLACDRTQYRYVVHGPAVPWSIWRAEHRIPRSVVNVMEAYGRPGTWWVSEQPMRAKLSPYSRLEQSA